MRTGVLTRWPVAVTVPVRPQDLGVDGGVEGASLLSWFEQARIRYLEPCRRVAGRDVELVVGAMRLSPPRLLLHPGTEVVVAVSTTELRTTSFDMRCRIRAAGGGVVATGSCSVSFIGRGSGEPVSVPDPVRREVLALEAAASHYA